MATVDIRVRRNRNGDRPITGTQRTAIEDAANDAERMAIEGLRVLAEIWNQPGRGRRRRRRRKAAWRANAIVVRWFGRGKLTNAQIRRTRRRMERIRKEFEKDVRFALIQHESGNRSYLCNGDNVAYCSPGTRIKLCPSWFRMSQHQRAKTVIHELSHKNGHIHHRGAIDPASAERLAHEHPRLARRNPENYEGYCGEF